MCTSDRCAMRVTFFAFEFAFMASPSPSSRCTTGAPPCPELEVHHQGAPLSGASQAVEANFARRCDFFGSLPVELRPRRPAAVTCLGRPSAEGAFGNAERPHHAP